MNSWFRASLALAACCGVAAAPLRTARAAEAAAPRIALQAAPIRALAKAWEEQGPAARSPAINFGRVVAFEDHRQFTYVMASSGSARSTRASDPAEPDEQPTWLRRAILLKPFLLVVEDQLAPPAGTPARLVLEAPAGARQHGNRFLASDGQTRVECHRLLPPVATLEPAEEPADGPEGRRWAVTAPASIRPVRFVHVIHVAPPSGQGVWKAAATETDGVVALEISENERQWRLTLGPGRLAPCRIALRDDQGRELLPERLLPAGVLPHGEQGRRLLESWDARYRRDTPPPWDTGRPSSDLRRAVEDGVLQPGRALELGCGAGTNAIYLAQREFEVTAIDIAPTALEIARRRAAEAGVRVRWLLADVLRPPELPPFDLIYDRGCYHGVRRQHAAGYVEAVRRLSRPGTLLLLLAGNANEPPPRSGPPRVREEELRADFSQDFEFLWLRTTRFDTREEDAAGAWAWSVLLRRRAAPAAGPR